MTTYNGQPVFRGASGANAGRGDDAHGVTPVSRFSAATRKAAPEAGTANGSQTAYGVSNNGGQGPGEGVGQVKSKYKEMRQSGLSPDDARGMATSSLAYPSGSGPGGQQGPNIKQITDYKGDSV